MSASAARSFFLAADAFRINDFVAPHQNLSKIFRQGLAASEPINDENAPDPLSPDLLRKMHAYWRASNYLLLRERPRLDPGELGL